MAEGSLSALSDERLAALSRNGEEAAFSELAIRYWPIIRARSLSFGDARCADPDDLAQEGLLGLLSAAQTYCETGDAAFRTYAFSCIRNRMISEWRRGSVKPDVLVTEEETGGLSETAQDPAAVVVREEELEQLRVRLKQFLKPLEFRVLMMQLGGYRYREIAEQLGVTEKTVDNALQRVRRKLSARTESWL